MRYIFKKHKGVNGFLHVPMEVVRKLNLKEGDVLIVKDENGLKEFLVVRRNCVYYIKTEYEDDRIFEVISKKAKETRDDFDTSIETFL